MDAFTIDRAELDDLLNQYARAEREAKPGAKFDEYYLVTRAADGRLEIKTGAVPRGFRPQKLKKSKKKPNTTRRPSHVRK